MAQSSKTHQERKTAAPALGHGGGRVLPFKPEMADREAFGEALQMKREAQNPHMKAGAIPQRLNRLPRKGELENPDQEADTTVADQGKQFASAEPPPITSKAQALDTSGGGNSPGGNEGTVRTDVASLQSYTQSKNVGQELGSNPDKHIGYMRLVELDADDGRRITVKVQGRTALDALHGGQPPSLDAQGLSEVSVEIVVVGDYGKRSVIQAQASGTEGDATIRHLIEQIAAEQGIPPSLLLPGYADDSYVQQALTVADRVQPAALRPAMEPTERLAEAEATTEKVELKDWETMTQEERRAETWDKFKEEFSWQEVATAIYVGAVTMFVMTKAPIFALIAGTMLAEAAIAYGVYDLVASLVEGKSIELSQFLKDGLLIVGGALAIVCTFAILMKAPGVVGMAGFAALMAAIAYVITEAVTAHFLYEEAVAAHSRAEMQRLAQESAKNVQGAVVDGVLVLPALKSLPKLWKEMTKPTMGAPGEEGMVGAAEEVANRSHDEENARGSTQDETPELQQKESTGKEGDLGPDELLTETGEVINTKYWNAPKEINGRRVYQRDDLFDPNFVDRFGRSNRARMEGGLAPIGHDGVEVNLHHLIQQEPGAMAEVGGEFHQKNTKTLHFVEDGKSFRTPNGRKSSWRRTKSGAVANTEAENSYESWRKKYWKSRAKDY